MLSDLENKKRYDTQLKQYLDLINQNKNIDIEKNDIKKNHLNNKKTNHKNILEFLIICFLFAIIFDVIYALIGNYFVIDFIDLEGSWSYFAYVVYGTISGRILANISRMNNSILGCIGTIITVVCMLLSFYQYMYETLLLIYGSLE